MIAELLLEALKQDREWASARRREHTTQELRTPADGTLRRSLRLRWSLGRQGAPLPPTGVTG